MVLTFDPSEGELVGYSYSEGSGGMWTDGLVATAYTQSENAQRSVRWKSITEQRKREHLKAVSTFKGPHTVFADDGC